MSRPARLLLLAAALVAHAEARAGERGTPYAFLVGCSQYLKTEFKELPYTGNDVLGLREALIATGFEPDNVVVLHDGAQQRRYLPEKAKILDELDRLLDGMIEADTLVVALSGHGLQYKGDPVSYFVPIDGKLGDKKTLLPLDGPGGLYAKLKACKAKKKLLVVNACRNDPTVSVDFASNQAPLADEDRPDEVPQGIAALYSCKAGQKSYYDPQRKRALFFEHFIKAWQGEYSKGEKVTLEQVFAEVIARTRADADRTLRAKQSPQAMREFSGEWVVPASPLASGRALLRKGESAQALALLDKAVAMTPGSAAARVARGMAQVRTGHYAEALADFQEAARLDPESGEAALQLGRMYWSGQGVTTANYAEAMRLFRHAADRGEAEALTALGDAYRLGRGVARDDAEAARWYQKAADRGEPQGMYELAGLFEKGRGVAKDDAQALRLYRRAVEQDHAAAMYRLGLMSYEGRGVAQDYGTALEWYRKAADRDYAPAIHVIGWLYQNGQGVAKDYAEAMRWYRKAAGKDFAPAINQVGYLYNHGLGVSKDRTEAAQWYRKAADLGNGAAMWNLGFMYEVGDGVAKDEAEALRLYRKAAAKGVAQAMHRIGFLYENGRGVTLDVQEAIRWYRKAAEKGNDKARKALERLGKT